METINIEQLIKPISQGNPTGTNLRQDASPDSLYYKIKDARQAARSVERKFMQMESEEKGTAHWQQVYELALSILQNHSKDIEILAWLTESLLRKYAFAGLGQGFNLIKIIIENYWDDLYPQADEEGIETKIAALIGLNGEEVPGTLILPMAAVTITQGNISGPFALWQYKQALDIEKITDIQKRDQKIKEVGFSLEHIKQAVGESSSEFYRNLLIDIENCQQAFQGLDDMLMEKCAHHSPPTSTIKAALNDVLEHVGFLLQDAPFKTQVLSESKEIEDGNMITEEETIKAHYQLDNRQIISGEVNNRDDALVVLTKVAKFFEQTEPHSPIPFLLKRAVRWGGLSLPKLLQELIAEEEARNNVFKLTGIMAEEVN